MTEQEARTIIAGFQNNAPVNVTAIAEALGLNVWESDAELPDGISGKLFRDPISGGSSGFSIIVRESDPYVRKRFTVAHEVGHFVLHRNQIGESLTDDELYRSGLSTRQEAQANRFAADILMPKDLILKTINRLGDDPQVLASEFKVSEAAMRIRLDAVWPTPYTRVAV
jgi:hypothetical protein